MREEEKLSGVYSTRLANNSIAKCPNLLFDLDLGADNESTRQIVF